MMTSISSAVAKKEAKIVSLDQQKENLSREVRGLENSQEVCKAKIKKRKGQIHDSELEVKSIREKLGEIQKRVTPESIKFLNKQLDKQDVMKLNIMLNSFTALVLNKNEPTNDEIRDTIMTHSNVVETMVGALQVSFKADANVQNKHKEVLREVQKAFTDSTQPDNKACKPYSALLAWAQNFPFYVQHTSQLNKLNQDLAKETKELELKNEKQQNIKAVLVQIDANIELLR